MPLGQVCTGVSFTEREWKKKKREPRRSPAYSTIEAPCFTWLSKLQLFWERFSQRENAISRFQVAQWFWATALNRKKDNELLCAMSILIGSTGGGTKLSVAIVCFITKDCIIGALEWVGMGSESVSHSIQISGGVLAGHPEWSFHCSCPDYTSSLDK